MNLHINFLKKLKSKIIIRIRNIIDNESMVHLAPQSIIGKDVTIKSSTLSGFINIGEGSRIVQGVSLITKSKIEIGRYTTINGPNTDVISAINDVRIGSFCSIARNVSFQEFNHDYNNFTTYFIKKNLIGKKNSDSITSKGDIIIENDVWVGTHCVILSGAHIGTGAVVSANSVVSGIIPPYAIVGGSPAKVIKYRFSNEKINRLLKSRWWDTINESNYKEFEKYLNNP